jgi:hypothetical protein
MNDLSVQMALREVHQQIVGLAAEDVKEEQKRT